MLCFAHVVYFRFKRKKKGKKRVRLTFSRIELTLNTALLMELKQELKHWWINTRVEHSNRMQHTPPQGVSVSTVYQSTCYTKVATP